MRSRLGPFLLRTRALLSLSGSCHRCSRSASSMASVQYNWLGSTGLKVSNICLGTMTFGEHPLGRPYCNEVDAHAILDRYAALGGNFIDTADMYQNGKSEIIVGNWLKRQQRERFIVATKFGKMNDKNNVNSLGASRHNMFQCVEKSLANLQTSYIDLYYVHVWDDATPVEETVKALNDLVRTGKVRYVAMSNAKGWQIQKLIEVARRLGCEQMIALQQQYSLLCRSIEWEITEVCQREGLALLPWSPLKGGWLSGKIKRGMEGAEAGTRVAWSTGRAHHSHPDWAWFSSNDQAWTVLDKVQAIAEAKGRTVPQVALRWLLQKQVVPSVVIGVRTMQQFEENMGAASGWELSPEEMKELDEVSAIPAPYPYDYITLDNVTRQRPH